MIKAEAIRLPFSYAAGAVGSAYLAGLTAGRLLASHCDSCERSLSPARSLCPFCGRRVAEDLLEVGPGGLVESWTTLPDGTTFVLVRLDGADTAMLHRLVDDPPGDSPPAAAASANLAVGDRVRSVFDSTGLVGFEVMQS